MCSASHFLSKHAVFSFDPLTWTFPRGWIRGNRKSGPVLVVAVSFLLGRYGIEIEIDAMQNDGSTSWVVISRGMKKYVTQMLQAEEDVDMNQPSSTPAQNSAYSSSMQATLPGHRRKWNTVPVTNSEEWNGNRHAYLLSKPYAGSTVDTDDCSTRQWIEHLIRGSNKQRFHDRLNF